MRGPSSTPITPLRGTHCTPVLICDRLPEGCIAFPVTNNDSSPHLRPGDIVVVDPDDRAPEHHEMFLVEFGKSTDNPTRRIVETWLQPGRYGKPSQGREMEDGFAWMLGAFARPRSRDELLRRLEAGQQGGLFSDGPYFTEGAGYDCLVDKVVGRIVGILEPAFHEPMRVLA